MFDTNTMTVSPTAGFAMPMISRERVASVHALSLTTGVVSLPAVDAGDLRVQGTAVCGYRTLGDAVVTGAFPGTSAWSPPNQR